MKKPFLNQLNIVTSDFSRSADFYRRLGIAIADPLVNASGKPFHAAGTDEHGSAIEFDSPDFARVWNRGWSGVHELAGRIVLGFGCETRDDVDRIFAELTQAGYRGLIAPYDAFWGSRYAIVEDPNGLAVGLMSPADSAFRSDPPEGWTASRRG
jgi:catechol 2,3-dioxygenase-like lactoylglutathione lyase family enzyme